MSGVKGATKTLREAAGAPRRSKPTGGVLGAVHTISRTARTANLPFTGFPLWAAALIGVGLLGSGLALRRHARLTH
jgi:hypothetical protein